MVRKYGKLLRIDNDHQITQDSDCAFTHNLQRGLLLALKEKGQLNAMQYRHAEERLNGQRREYARKKQLHQKSE